MNGVTIIIGSITYAMKAQKALKEMGIHASLIKKNGETRRGCSYGISVSTSHFMATIAKLKELNIEYEVENTRGL